VQSHRIADFSSFVAALSAYVAAAGRLDIDTCAIAAAGPVGGERVKITNNAWSIDRGETAAVLGGIPVVLVNDLEAVAAALPHLAADDVTPIGGPLVTRPERRTMLALNVGTGFGAASAICRGGRWWTMPSEAGHMTLGPTASDGDEPRPNDATIESVLSGHGVAALYGRLAAAGGRTGEPLHNAAEVFARAGRDPIAARTVERVTLMLGRVAGNLALATAAWGGVYLCGSVATAWAALADAAPFRAEFIGKGPMRERLKRVPTTLIRRDNVALFGLAMLPVSG
jgi:glucokinase